MLHKANNDKKSIPEMAQTGVSQALPASKLIQNKQKNCPLEQQYNLPEAKDLAQQLVAKILLAKLGHCNTNAKYLY